MKSEKVSKLDTYLTDIKELPPIPKEKPVEKVDPPKEIKTENAISNIQNAKPPVEEEAPKKMKDKILKEEKDEIPQERDLKVFTFKDIMLGIINIVSVIFLIFLLTRIPTKSKEFQAERIKENQNKEDLASLFGDISEDKKKPDMLNNMFLNETGVVNFVNDVEKLKGENKAVQGVTFASQKPIKDKNGLSGLPVVIEMRGSWETIGVSLHEIQLLPYLFRAVTIESNPSKEDANVILLKYGGFLYVSENFSQK